MVDRKVRKYIEFIRPWSLMTTLAAMKPGTWNANLFIPGHSDKGQPFTKPATGEMVDSKSYRYKVQTKIQDKTVIVGQLGATAPDGTFTLELLNTQMSITENMFCYFHTGFQAVVLGKPQKGSQTTVAKFQGTQNRIFDYSLMVAPQPGQKTLWGMHTGYSEDSLGGASVKFGFEEFLQYSTLSRKATSITGTAKNQILRVEFNGKPGGWFYADISQIEAQACLELDWKYIHGESTMMDINGNPISTAPIDPNTNLPIVTGSGLVEQIRGNGNDMFASGNNGYPTVTDIKRMMNKLLPYTGDIYGSSWEVLVSQDGYANAQEIFANYGVTQNTTPVVMATGGSEIEVGYQYTKFSFAGNKVTLIQVPMWSNTNAFTQMSPLDGNSIQGKMMIFLNRGSQGKPNLEILPSGGMGIDRSWVTEHFPGMTGDRRTGRALTPQDRDSYEVMSETFFIINNPYSCGIIHGQ